MNRKGILPLIIIGIVAAVIIGGGFIADTLLRQNLGIGLLDLFKAIGESSNTLEAAPSLDSVRSQIGITAYDTLASNRDVMIGTMSEAANNLGVINSNPDITNLIKTTFGSDYKIYLFSVTSIGNLTFKVFEWSVELMEGNITTFADGELFESYNVKVQADQDVAFSIFTGNASPEEIAEWATTSKLKINPITEVTKVISALPQIMSVIRK